MKLNINFGIRSFVLLTQILANLATILGVPFAIMLFTNELRKEREEDEYKSFDAVDNKYVEFKKLCLQYPELHLHLHGDEDREFTKEQQNQRAALYEILFSIFERVYILYHENPTEHKRSQWLGWEKYLKLWIQKKGFREVWKVEGQTFDANFAQYVDVLIFKYQWQVLNR